VSTSTVAQPRAHDLGKPQRKYVVEPREIPVPAPLRREDEQPLPAVPEPVGIPERKVA